MPSKFDNVKKFVKAHAPSAESVAIYTIITLGVVAAIQHAGIKDVTNFLREKNLLDEYYSKED